MCKHGSTAILHIDGKVINVDTCIAPVVYALNVAGIKTVASCCGHGHRPGTIAVADGREIIIAPDYESARNIDKLFPDIHGGTGHILKFEPTTLPKGGSE